MTLFRFRTIVYGGRTYVRLFAGAGPGVMGACGNLTFTNAQWADFLLAIQHHGQREGSAIEVLDEDSCRMNNDNPPAFPRPGTDWATGAGQDWHNGHDGMTLRDYFAAKAMQGAVSGGCLRSDADWKTEAELAYGIADAMLKTRATR